VLGGHLFTLFFRYHPPKGEKRIRTFAKIEITSRALRQSRPAAKKSAAPAGPHRKKRLFPTSPFQRRISREDAKKHKGKRTSLCALCVSIAILALRFSSFLCGLCGLCELLAEVPLPD
jgi:hypothetical protein